MAERKKVALASQKTMAGVLGCSYTRGPPLFLAAHCKCTWTETWSVTCDGIRDLSRAMFAVFTTASDEKKHADRDVMFRKASCG